MHVLRAILLVGETLPDDTVAPPVRQWKIERWWSIPVSHAATWAFNPRSNDDYHARFAFLFEVVENWVPEDVLSEIDLRPSPEG